MYMTLPHVFYLFVPGHLQRNIYMCCVLLKPGISILSDTLWRHIRASELLGIGKGVNNEQINTSYIQRTPDVHQTSVSAGTDLWEMYVCKVYVLCVYLPGCQWFAFAKGWFKMRFCVDLMYLFKHGMKSCWASIVEAGTVDLLCVFERAVGCLRLCVLFTVCFCPSFLRAKCWRTAPHSTH